MKQSLNRTSKRICAFGLALVLMLTSFMGSLISRNDAQASENTSSNVIINNFDETDVTYTNTEGWFSNAMTFSAKRDDNSELCADHASVEEGVGVDGSKGARFWQIRSSSSNDQNVSYVRLYDTAENDYRLFTPEPNTKYTISLKIKSVVCSKNIYVQLKNSATDGTIAYTDTVVASLNTEAIVASADADWQELKVTFTTGDTVAPLYVVLNAHDVWWEKAAEVYVDDICITKKMPVPSNQVVNDFDEADVTYTNTEGWYSNAMTFSAKRDDNSELCADHASIEEGVGVDGSKGARFWQIRSATDNDQNVSYVRIYDTAENDYRMFTPEPNTKYTISLKIKSVICSKNIYVQLKNAAEDGTIAYTDPVIASFNEEAIVASADADWQELKVTFTTGDTVAPLYISLRVHDSWWEKAAEVYVDDICVAKKVYTPSDEVTNNFDETDVTYTNTEGWYSNAMTYSAKRNDNSELCADHASVEEGVGVDGSKGARFWQIRSATDNDQNVSYVRIYDTAENDYRLFTPEANTKYTISLKIKSVICSKNIYVQLKNSAADGTIAYTDPVIASLNEEAIVASADADWQELKVTFTTGDTVAPLYISLRVHDSWWEKAAEVYVDDIKVAKKVYTPSDKIVNDFDETDVTYTNTEGWTSNAMTFSATRDENSELCADHASIEEGVGVDGTKGARFWQIRAGSASNDQTLSYVRLYDTADNDYRLFTPEANTKYTVSLKIKAVTSGKNIYVQLRNAAEDGTIAYTDTVVASLNADAIVASADADWQELTATFTTGDTVAPLYIALKSHDTWWATGAEVYVDDIKVAKKVYTPSDKIVNDFDETDVTYTNTEGWTSNAMTFSATRDENSELCADHASVEESVGVDGTKAARFWQIRSASSNDQAVSYVRLYDTADNDYRLFTPEANTTYSISLKIKAVTSAKNISVQLRSAEQDGTIAYTNTVITDLTTNAIVASADADWQELTTTFTTGDSVAPLYVVVKSIDSWWATGTEVYVDDIVVEKVKAVVCHNYCANGQQDETVIVGTKATFADLPTPEMSGSKFMGYYMDAEYTTPVETEASIGETNEVWVKWNFLGNVTEDITNDVDVRDLARLKKLVVNNEYKETADLNNDGVLNKEDLSEMYNILLDTVITFSLFADFHYKEDMYMTSIEDMNSILSYANDNKVDFILHAGDFCNDYIGSPELMNAYLNNNYGIDAYGVYGNHELESENNSMQVVTPNLTNRKDEVVWGTADGKIGDGSIGYYYFDKGEIRVVCTDTQYAYLEATQEWVHNPTNSYGEQEGAIKGSSLGPVQLEWLENVLTDAANNGKKCLVIGHSTFNVNWASASPDAEAVAAIYARVNAIQSGTVMMSMNGHYHTNRMQMVDNVFYFDINTARNGWWEKATTQHYTSGQTFEFISYDTEGNPVDAYDKDLNTLAQATNTWFFEDPISAIVKIHPYTGKIEVVGMQTNWLYDVVPSGVSSITTPKISNAMISIGK